MRPDRPGRVSVHGSPAGRRGERHPRHAHRPKIRAWLSGWTGLESATEHMLTCSARRTLDT